MELYCLNSVLAVVPGKMCKNIVRFFGIYTKWANVVMNCLWTAHLNINLSTEVSYFTEKCVCAPSIAFPKIRRIWPIFSSGQLFWLLSTGSRRHSDAAHEIRLIGCCILLNVVPKTVPLSGSSQSPLDRRSPFGRLASLEAMRLFYYLFFVTIPIDHSFLSAHHASGLTNQPESL